jgi:hypothetical protein
MRATAAERGGRLSGAPADPTIASPRRRPRPIAWGVLPRELAAAFLLLVLVLVLSPARPGQGPASPVWDYQHEQVVVAGDGPLNAYARTAMRATAWLGRASIERQRDVDRLNLLRFLAGEPLAAGMAGWRQRHQPALQGATAVAVLALVAFGVLARPARRTWLVVVLLLFGLTLLVTKPDTTMRVASAPSTAIPAGVAGLAGSPSPAGRAGAPPPADRHALSGRYWIAFVAGPLSRLQTGSPVLASAPPAAKAGVLDSVRRRVPGVRAWAAGRHGLQRVVIATLALSYVLPFAVLLGVLAMVATCAQALLLLLGLATLGAMPLALEPRWRPAVTRWWLRPLLATALLLTAATLASLLVMWLATVLHGGDELIGTLLAGSIWPLLTGALTAWWLHRRRLRAAVAEGRPPVGRTLRDAVSAVRPPRRGPVRDVIHWGRSPLPGMARGAAPAGPSSEHGTARGAASAGRSSGRPTLRDVASEGRSGRGAASAGRSRRPHTAGDAGAKDRAGRGAASAGRSRRPHTAGDAGAKDRAGREAAAGRSRGRRTASDAGSARRTGGGATSARRSSGRRAVFDVAAEPARRRAAGAGGTEGEWP